MKEQDFQTKIMKFLYEQGVFAFKVVNATTSGHTDITASINGVFVGIEVKTENGRVTPLQEYTHKRLAKSGGVAIVVRPSAFNEFKLWVLEMKQHSKIHINLKKMTTGKDIK